MYFILVHYGNTINTFKANNITIGTEEKVAIIFAGFLLSLPIGLAINAISWFALGSLLYYLSWIWSDNSFFFDKASKIDGNYLESKNLFKFKSNTFYNGAYYLSGLYNTYGLPVPNIDHIRGIKRFIRSFSFLMLVSAFMYKDYFWTAIGFASISILIVSLLDMETTLRNYKYGYYLLLPHLDKVKKIDAEMNIEGMPDFKNFKIRMEKIGRLIIETRI